MRKRWRLLAIIVLVTGIAAFANLFRPHVDPRYTGQWDAYHPSWKRTWPAFKLLEDGTWKQLSPETLGLSSHVHIGPPPQRTWFVQWGTLTLRETGPDRYSRSFLSSIGNSLLRGEINWRHIRQTALRESGQAEVASYDIIPVSGDIMLRKIGPEGHSRWGQKLVKIQEHENVATRAQ